MARKIVVHLLKILFTILLDMLLSYKLTASSYSMVYKIRIRISTSHEVIF